MRVQKYLGHISYSVGEGYLKQTQLQLKLKHAAGNSITNVHSELQRHGLSFKLKA